MVYARRIGYPVIIKAAAGGGGRGMRIVEKQKDMEKMYKLATNEAEKAFNDSSVFIEKYVQNHFVRLNDKEPPYDRIAELWFKDMDSLRTANIWYTSDKGKILRDDEARFLDTSKMVRFICEEAIIK